MRPATACSRAMLGSELSAELADWIASERAKRTVAESAFIVGLAGAQGSGKTTLARALIPALAQRGLRAVAVSIDDFYLTRVEREALAHDVHPLFATRGLPGTHDVLLALRTLDALAAARSGERVACPSFDKAHDDRAPRAQWPEHEGPIEVLLFE